MALQTFGVTATTVAADLPQVNVASNAPLTSDRLTVLINQCGAEVCGLVDAYYGAGTADSIGNDSGATYPVPYSNCARILLVLLRPRVYRAAHHVLDPAIIEDAEAEAEALRKRLAKNPQAEIGLVLASSEGPALGVRTSTSGLGVDISSETRDTNGRLRWGGRRANEAPRRGYY